jgi:hypothetical protein
VVEQPNWYPWTGRSYCNALPNANFATQSFVRDLTVTTECKIHLFEPRIELLLLPLLDMAYAQPFPLAAPQQQQKPVAPTFGPDLAVRLICPECRDPNPNIVEEFGSGDLVCGNCGLVLGDRIVDTRSEWRVCLFPLGLDPNHGLNISSLKDVRK